MTRLSAWAKALGVAALLLIVSASAHATVMVEVPLEEMIQQADAIVYGRVVRSDVRVAIDDGQMVPQTYTTIEVTEWLGGEGGETVQLRELGGTYDGITHEVVGVPTYAVGDEVIVFLERREGPRYDLRTFAMAQGKFVVQAQLEGPRMVARDLDGVSFYRWADGNRDVVEPGPEPRMPLDAFLGYVRQLRGNTVPGGNGAVR